MRPHHSDPTWARWAPGPRLAGGRVHAVQLSVTIPRYCGNPLKPLRGTRPRSWLCSFASSPASHPLSDLDSHSSPNGIDLADSSFPSQTHSDTKLSSSRLSLNTHTHTHIHARTQQRDWLTAQGNVSCAAAPPSADMGAFRVTSPNRAHYEWKPGSDFWEVKTFLLFEVHQVKVYLKLKNRKLCINIINNHHISGC